MIEDILTFKYLGLENTMINGILKDFNSEELQTLYGENSFKLLFEKGYIGSKLDKKISNKAELKKVIDKVEKIIFNSRNENINIISIYDENYPESLRFINNKPIVIFAKGNLELLNNKKRIAAVGTRKPNSSTVTKIKETISVLSNEQVIIVSGLANGVDSISHETCLNSKGKTIAVLAHGLDHIYPKNNTNLANEILESDGLLISEYPYGETPKKKNFVERNRIVSGLSEIIIVFEASEKSGTMHTARFAYKQRKTIYCPFDTEDNMSSGVLKLLLSGSAVPYWDAKEIINQLEGE